MNMRVRTAVQLRALVMQVLTVAAGASFGACAVTAEDPSSERAVGTSADGGVELYAADGCRPAAPPTIPSACGPYSVKIEGDPSTCSNCLTFCGQSVPCRFDEDVGSIMCTPLCPMEAGPVDGRRPPCVENSPERPRDLGTHFARMAFYEAASVDAFAILHRELKAHGAPGSLLRSVLRARLDEVRHARRAKAMARSFGASTLAPRVAGPSRVRTLYAIAVENAREGCARELFGAAIGLHQAAHARDPRVRAFYAEIARDELRHAALALRMHQWLIRRLTPQQRARVEKTRQRSLHQPQGFDHGDAHLGIPSAARRARIASALDAMFA
jgi:hypothetical protein